MGPLVHIDLKILGPIPTLAPQILGPLVIILLGRLVKSTIIRDTVLVIVFNE